MSPTSQRIIRRLPPSRVADFDERLWPVNCAILILTGFAAGLAMATGDFHTDRLLQNAWFRLGLVGLGVVALLAAVVFLQRTMIRRVQLCVVISLLVHLWLGMALHQQYLAAVAAKRNAPVVERRTRPERQLQVPDYHWENRQRPPSRHTFAKPVETQSPRPTDPEPISPQPIDHNIPPERKPNVEPEPPRPEQPKVAELRRAEPSAPRRSELAAGTQISRQPWRQFLFPDEPIPRPEIASHNEEPARRPRANVSAPEHRQDEVALHQRRVFDRRPSATRPWPVAQLARRAAAEQQPAPTPSTPRPMAKLSRAAELASAEMKLPKPVPRHQSPPSPIEAAPSSLARRTPDSTLARAQRRADPRLPATVRREKVARLPLAAATRDRTPSNPSRPLARNTPKTVTETMPHGTAFVRPRASRPAVAHATAARRPTAAPQATAARRAGSAAPPTARPHTGSGRVGALASLDASGARRPVAVARRSTASQRDADPTAAASDSAVTIARADHRGGLGALDAIALPSWGLRGGISSKTASAGRGEPARLEALATSGARRMPSATATDGARGKPAAGRLTGAEMLGRVSTTPGLRTGPRRLPSGDASALALAAKRGGAPLAKSDTPGLPRGLAGPIDALPSAPVQVASAQQGKASEPVVAPAVGLEPAKPRGHSGGLPVHISAKPGPGGLSHEPSPEVGIPSRRARPESEIVHAARPRLLVDRSGGTLPIDGLPAEPSAEAFRQRDPGRRARRVEIYGGTEGTERAVEMGLVFLAQCQFDDGHWSLDRLPEKMQDVEDPALGQMTSDTAATGLALLSFLGAGYTHESDKYREVVRRGLDWLIKHQKPDGDLFLGGTGYAWFYSHGIATIALCEVHGMTRDPGLREPAQRAIRFIVDSQHPRRGGWRYRPRVESDTSVAGWQLMALKSAQMADLKVPQTTLEAVSRWLDTAQSQGGARYTYNPYAGDTPSQRHGRRPNLAMTAEGSLMRMYLGWTREHAALRDAADYLKANLPSLGTPKRPTRDVYYWYYATQVMFQMQGEHWKAWNGRLQPILQESQESSGPLTGSWHPTLPERDRWGHAGGRLYVTTMNLLMLEVYYRHLPLFQTLE